MTRDPRFILPAVYGAVAPALRLSDLLPEFPIVLPLTVQFENIPEDRDPAPAQHYLQTKGYPIFIDQPGAAGWVWSAYSHDMQAEPPEAPPHQLTLRFIEETVQNLVLDIGKDETDAIVFGVTVPLALRNGASLDLQSDASMIWRRPADNAPHVTFEVQGDDLVISDPDGQPANLRIDLDGAITINGNAIWHEGNLDPDGLGGGGGTYIEQSVVTPLQYEAFYDAWTIDGHAIWHAGNLDPDDLGGGGIPTAPGWANPSGSGYNKGSFNADDEHPLSNPPTGSQVQALQDRLKDTRAVLRALILDLKTIGILGS